MGVPAIGPGGSAIIMTRAAIALLLSFGLAPVVGGKALAQVSDAANWPSKPIRAILPIAPGTGADVVTRLVCNQLSIQLGQQIVIENRGGAGGTIGTAMVSKAEPDGYTLLIQASAHSAAPAAYPNIPYDPVRDFSAVIAFGTLPNVTVEKSRTGS